MAPPLDWPAFADRVASHASPVQAEITRESRVVRDLGLDSLALAELIVTCVDELGMTLTLGSLGDVAWSEVSIGELHDCYTTGRPLERRSVKRFEIG